MIRRTGLCTRRSKGFERKNPMFKGGERERREFNSRHFCMTTEFRVTKMLIKPAHFPLEKAVPSYNEFASVYPAWVRLDTDGSSGPFHSAMKSRLKTKTGWTSGFRQQATYL